MKDHREEQIVVARLLTSLNGGFPRRTIKMIVGEMSQLGIVPETLVNNVPQLTSTALETPGLNVTDEDRAAAALYAGGMTVAEVASKLNLSSQTIRKRINSVVREYLLWLGLDEELYYLPIRLRNRLIDAGYITAKSLKEAKVDQLKRIRGIGKCGISHLLERGLVDEKEDAVDG